jgi:magnesium chelatase accessory protein
MRAAVDWAVEGLNWPNRAASRFVRAGGHTWHVQVMGSGPPLVLLHGTGAATHSWGDLAPLLAESYTVIALDFPGHGFTEPPPHPSGYSLPGVAGGVRALLTELGITPVALIGHSAGAAVGLRMALDQAGPAVVALNGALKPLPGIVSLTAPMMALGSLNPLTLRLLAARADSIGAVDRLMRATGSRLHASNLELYRLLLRTERHLRGTLSLMGRWDLGSLCRDLPRLVSPLTMIVAERDRAVPPETAQVPLRQAPHARCLTMSHLGHLAHEEAPHRVAKLVQEALAEDLSA